MAGLELGGVPVAIALSLETGLPCAFVPKAAKTYGTTGLAEGPVSAGKRMLVVEARSAGHQLPAAEQKTQRLSQGGTTGVSCPNGGVSFPAGVAAARLPFDGPVGESQGCYRGFPIRQFVIHL